MIKKSAIRFDSCANVKSCTSRDSVKRSVSFRITLIQGTSTLSIPVLTVVAIHRLKRTKIWYKMTPESSPGFTFSSIFFATGNNGKQQTRAKRQFTLLRLEFYSLSPYQIPNITPLRIGNTAISTFDVP